MRPTVLRTLIVGTTTLALASLVCFAGLALSADLPSNYRMARHGIWTDGLITEKTRDHGGNVLYSFRANNRLYTGRGGLIGGVDTVQVGDHVSVLYDAENPNMSTLARADQNFWELTAVLIAGSLIFGILCTAFFTPIWYVWQKRKQTPGIRQ